jgi:8-oxo-dGTP pyrophosphatase MutT (NUDIX family)
MRDIVTGVFGGPGVFPEPDAARNIWPVPAGIAATPLKSAAVLVPLIEHPAGMTVLLTQRTTSLSSHAGQISFPGGKHAPLDESPEDTALRETEEEIGVPRHRVELVGRMNACDTRTGFRVVPVVGLLRPPVAPVPDPAEVDEIFEVPVDFALDPVNHSAEYRIHRGERREFWVVRYEGRYIWGLTARILVELSGLMRR